MNVSLNEVEATAKRATRGAGYQWGLAEEAAKAVRWLCANDIDGCGALAGLIERFDGVDLAERVPLPDDTGWYGKGSVLCPLIAGAALSDCALDLADRDIRMGPVAAPCLLFPFAAHAARQLRNTVTVSWPAGAAVTDGDRISLTGPIGTRVDFITVCRGGLLGAPNRQMSRAMPEQGVWETLNRFAHRTYAPATAESRLLGAGAGLTDTD